MIITIHVTTRAKRNAVQKIDEGEYKILVNVVPERGKANQKVINLLAEYFDTAKSNIRLLSGATSRTKKIELIM